MLKSLSESDLKIVADSIKGITYSFFLKSKTTVFLCGASKQNKNSGRHKMTKLLMEDSKKFELLFPEDLFEDLMAGYGGIDLLTAENLLASSVDTIILFPESPGSFAELGAFSYSGELASKTICFIENKRSKNKSFINYGPARLIKSSQTGKVYSYRQEDFIQADKKKNLLRKLTRSIKKIKEKSPSKKGFGNILITDQFVLPCIFLFDSIEIVDLIKLVEFATGESKKLSDLAVRSALSKLISEKLISRSSGNKGYNITQKGKKYLTKRVFYMEYSLNSLRMEIMNTQYRKKTSINKKGLFLI